ncbi:MAG TPA: DNA-processing protein DprA [Bacteroidia bacterium]|nr:DNA-processing protein DprA [Bacteroidia bacterium]HNT79444.1 DNA-processing protein DprA [Bacteroidia bacterium]
MNQPDNSSLVYKIALTMIPGIGPITAKSLVGYCGSAEAVLKENYQKLLRIPNIGAKTAQDISKFEITDIIHQECEFIEQNNIIPYYFLDNNYPSRLKHCNDAPILLFSRGNVDFNVQKSLAIVGTRKATAYGKDITEKIVSELTDQSTLIVSGMAYGIDIASHKAALSAKLKTVGVMAHGLDQVYPASHQSIAEKIFHSGALVSEYRSNTLPDKQNFPSRNRIIAGLCDAVLVVEASESGGALITAHIAHSYNRDVFSVPGRTSDPYSVGCNNLIKRNVAMLVQSAKDIEEAMGWEVMDAKLANKQTKLMINLSLEEESIVELLRSENALHIDSIIQKAGMNNSKVASTLLNLEFSGIIRSLPGKVYELT